jgi:hypothetical protein
MVGEFQSQLMASVTNLQSQEKQCPGRTRSDGQSPSPGTSVATLTICMLSDNSSKQPIIIIHVVLWSFLRIWSTVTWIPEAGILVLSDERGSATNETKGLNTDILCLFSLWITSTLCEGGGGDTGWSSWPWAIFLELKPDYQNSHILQGTSLQWRLRHVLWRFVTGMDLRPNNNVTLIHYRWINGFSRVHVLAWMKNVL